MLTYNPVTNKLMPVSSPFCDTLSVAILSLKYPKSFAFENLSIFNLTTYLTLLVLVLFATLILHKNLTKGKFSKRNFCRKMFEVFLITSFDTRIPYITKEKGLVFRTVFTTLILSGLVMRKCFTGQLNAIRAVNTSYNYFSDLESVKNDPEINKIIVPDLYGSFFIKNVEKITNLEPEIHRNETEGLVELLNSKTVYYGYDKTLNSIQKKYPFIPMKVSSHTNKLGKMPIYYFAIFKDSPLFEKIFERLLIAFDFGITQFAFRNLERMENHIFRFSNQSEKVYELYEKSSYFSENWKCRPEMKMLKFGLCFLLAGFGFAFLTILYEMYVVSCFGKV